MNRPYHHKKFRASRILAGLFRGLAKLIMRWPLILLVVVVVSPIGPHLRIEYRYHGDQYSKQIIDCMLLGTRGYIYRIGHEHCSLVSIVDTRNEN